MLFRVKPRALYQSSINHVEGFPSGFRFLQAPFAAATTVLLELGQQKMKKRPEEKKNEDFYNLSKYQEFSFLLKPELKDFSWTFLSASSFLLADLGLIEVREITEWGENNKLTPSSGVIQILTFSPNPHDTIYFSESSNSCPMHFVQALDSQVRNQNLLQRFQMEAIHVIFDFFLTFF